MNSRKESLMYFVAMLMLLLATSAAWASRSIDAVREALADEIAANVGAATENAARLREKALKIRVDAAKVRTGEWYEVWPGVNGMVTNRVAGEIWNDAIQAAIDAHGAVYVPAREKPYYLDAPIVLSSGQAFVADRKAEFRLVPGVDMCLLRNRTVVGMNPDSLEIPNVPYDRGIYVEGGIWTSLLTSDHERNGNFWGHVSKTKPVHGCYGAFVLNHVDGIVLRDVTVSRRRK